MASPNNRVKGWRRLRRVPLTVRLGLLLVVGAAVAALVFVHYFDSHVDKKLDDASLCVEGESSLLEPSAQPTVGVGPDVDLPVLSLRVSHTTAASAAADLASAHLSPHPWDQESPDAPVLRCQSGQLTWFVDRKGHVTVGQAARSRDGPARAPRPPA